MEVSIIVPMKKMIFGTNIDYQSYTPPAINTTNSKVCVGNIYEYYSDGCISDGVEVFLEAKGIGKCTVTLTGYDTNKTPYKIIYNVTVVRMSTLSDCKKYAQSKGYNVEGNLYFENQYTYNNPYVPLYKFRARYKEFIINTNTLEIEPMINCDTRLLYSFKNGLYGPFYNSDYDDDYYAN